MPPLPPPSPTPFPYTTLFRSRRPASVPAESRSKAPIIDFGRDAIARYRRFDIDKHPARRECGEELVPTLFAEDAVRHRVLGEKRSEEHTSELQSLRHLVCRLP